jgi:hypothetical protein
LLRVVVPDLRAIVARYQRGEIVATEFLDELDVKYELDTDGFLKRQLAPFVRFPHKCMYDTAALCALLERLGFAASARAAFDSNIEGIESIELPHRTRDAVIVEARKREAILPMLNVSTAVSVTSVSCS